MSRLGVAVLLAVSPLLALGQAGGPASSPGTDRAQAKLVSRLYDLTHGYEQRCRNASPDAATEFAAALVRFTEKNPRLMALLVESPHYATTRSRFAARTPTETASETATQLGHACTYLASLMRALSDTAEGQKSVKEFEEILSQ